MPESGEEASALCSYVFEGHYTDEATERTVDCWRWWCWFLRNGKLVTVPSCVTIGHRQNIELASTWHTLRHLSKAFKPKTLPSGGTCRPHAAAEKFARVCWCLANLAQPRCCLQSGRGPNHRWLIGLWRASSWGRCVQSWNVFFHVFFPGNLCHLERLFSARSGISAFHESTFKSFGWVGTVGMNPTAKRHGGHSIAPDSCHSVTLKGCLSANCHAQRSSAIATCSKP